MIHTLTAPSLMVLFPFHLACNLVLTPRALITTRLIIRGRPSLYVPPLLPPVCSLCGLRFIWSILARYSFGCDCRPTLMLPPARCLSMSLLRDILIVLHHNVHILYRNI